MCLTIEVTYNLRPGHMRRRLGGLAKMGVYVTLTVKLPCILEKRISTIKPISCVSDTSNCGQANATVCLNIKVTFNLTPEHIRRLLGRLDKLGV